MATTSKNQKLMTEYTFNLGIERGHCAMLNKSYSNYDKSLRAFSRRSRDGGEYNPVPLEDSFSDDDTTLAGKKRARHSQFLSSSFHNYTNLRHDLERKRELGGAFNPHIVSPETSDVFHTRVGRI